MILGALTQDATDDLLARSKLLHQIDQPAGTVYVAEVALDDLPPLAPVFPGAPSLEHLPGLPSADLLIFRNVVGGSLVVLPAFGKGEKAVTGSAHERARALIAARGL